MILRSGFVGEVKNVLTRFKLRTFVVYLLKLPFCELLFELCMYINWCENIILILKQYLDEVTYHTCLADWETNNLHILFDMFLS